MRDFHERQEHAQEDTFYLVAMLVIATFITVVVTAVAAALVSVLCSVAYMSTFVRMELPVDFFVTAFYDRALLCLALTSTIVLGTAVYKWWQVESGGGREVARQLGGTAVLEVTTDAQEKKLLNVVEELSIAAGIRAPRCFILQQEPGINAFAAGLHDKDMIVGVTRGAIDRLSRDQLQGVMAHEFSHIIHHDTRLNMRLIGALAGLQALNGAAGYLMNLGAGKSAGHSTLGGNAMGQIIAGVVGSVMYALGSVGEFFATLAKLAVNRQREFLADASAVELTRHPLGLWQALHIIAQEADGSKVKHRNASLASHLFLANVHSSWTSWLQTHPPLAERMRRLASVPQPSDTDGPTDFRVAPTSILSCRDVGPETDVPVDQLPVGSP